MAKDPTLMMEMITQSADFSGGRAMMLVILDLIVSKKAKHSLNGEHTGPESHTSDRGGGDEVLGEAGGEGVVAEDWPVGNLVSPCIWHTRCLKYYTN